MEKRSDHEEAGKKKLAETRYACGYMLFLMNFKSLRLRISGRMGGLGEGRAGGKHGGEGDDVNEKLDTTGLGVFQ